MPRRCAIELQTSVQQEAEGAYLFVDDDGRVLRYALEAERVRIGRDQSNDIWIDNLAVRPHHVLVYCKDGEHHLKVYEGAKVTLNGVPVSGLHRLYSGDRFGVADREFIYARDDSPAQVAVGLTVLVDGQVQHAVAYRRTRVRVGRRDADVVLNDPSINDRHLVIECYSARALYAFDLGTSAGTTVNGQRVEERCRLTDGSIVQVGRVTLRVHLLPAEAHGLLLASALPDKPKVPLAAPKPMDRSPAQRMDPSAQSPRSRNADPRPVSGGFIRPLHQSNAVLGGSVPAPEPESVPAVPVTMIGSVQQMFNEQQADGRPRGQEAPARAQDPGQRAVMLPLIRPLDSDLDEPTGPPVGRRAPVDDRPAVRVKPEVMQRSPAWADESSRRENLRVRARDVASEMVAVSPSPTGLHEMHTNVLDTSSVGDAVRGKADWLYDAPVPPPFDSRPSGAPLTQVLDTLGPDEVQRYRLEPAKEAAPPPVDDARYRLHRKSSQGELRRSGGAHERPRLQPRPLSAEERAVNPDWDRPQVAPEDMPPPLPRQADRSQRHVRVLTVDRSRRDFDDDGRK